MPAIGPPGSGTATEYTISGSGALESRTCSQNDYLSSRGGGQNRWHLLVNCNHGDSTTSRFRRTFSAVEAASAPSEPSPCPPRRWSVGGARQLNLVAGGTAQKQS
jgi:hypothetical protein